MVHQAPAVDGTARASAPATTTPDRRPGVDQGLGGRGRVGRGDGVDEAYQGGRGETRARAAHEDEGDEPPCGRGRRDPDAAQCGGGPRDQDGRAGPAVRDPGRNCRGQRVRDELGRGRPADDRRQRRALGHESRREEADAEPRHAVRRGDEQGARQRDGDAPRGGPLLDARLGDHNDRSIITSVMLQVWPGPTPASASSTPPNVSSSSTASESPASTASPRRRASRSPRCTSTSAARTGCWQRCSSAGSRPGRPSGRRRSRQLARRGTACSHSSTRWWSSAGHRARPSGAASSRPRPSARETAGGDDPVLSLVEADTTALVVRLRELVDEAGIADPEGTVARLLVVYNGALASLLRGAPADPLTQARAIADALLPAVA